MNPPIWDEHKSKLSSISMAAPYKKHCSTENRLLVLLKDLKFPRCIVHEEVPDVDSHLRQRKKLDLVRKTIHDDDEATSALTPDSQEHSGSTSTPSQPVTRPHCNELTLETLHTNKYPNAPVILHYCNNSPMKAVRTKQPTFDAMPVLCIAQTVTMPPHPKSSQSLMKSFPATEYPAISTQRRPTFVKIEHQPETLRPIPIVRKPVHPEAGIRFSEETNLQNTDIRFADSFWHSPHPNLRLRRPTINDGGCVLVKPPVRKLFLYDERFLQPRKPYRRIYQGKNHTEEDVMQQPQSAQDVIQSSKVPATLTHSVFVRMAIPLPVSTDKALLIDSGVNRRIGDTPDDFLNKDSTSRIQATLMRMAEEMTPKQDPNSQYHFDNNNVVDLEEWLKHDLPSFAQKDSIFLESPSHCSDQVSLDKDTYARTCLPIDKATKWMAKVKCRKSSLPLFKKNVSRDNDADTFLDSADRGLQPQLSRPAQFEINFRKYATKAPSRRRGLNLSLSSRSLFELERYEQSDAPESSQQDFIRHVSRQSLVVPARISLRRFNSQQNQTKKVTKKATRKVAKVTSLKTMDWTDNVDTVPPVHQSWSSETKQQPNCLDWFHDDAFHKSWHQDFQIIVRKDHANNQGAIVVPSDISSAWEGQEKDCLADLLEASGDEQQCPSERSCFSFDFQPIDWNADIPHNDDKCFESFALTNRNQFLSNTEGEPFRKVSLDDVTVGNISLTDDAFDCPHTVDVVGLVDDTVYSTLCLDHTTTHLKEETNICEATHDIDGLDHSTTWPVMPYVPNAATRPFIVNADPHEHPHEHSFGVDVATRTLSPLKVTRLGEYLQKSKNCYQQEPTPTSLFKIVDSKIVMHSDDEDSVGILDMKSNDGTWIDEDVEHFEGSTGSFSRVTFILPSSVGNSSILQMLPSPEFMDVATSLEAAILEGYNLRKFHEALANEEKNVALELEACLRHENALREIILLNSSAAALRRVDSSLQCTVHDHHEELQMKVAVLSALRLVSGKEVGEIHGIRARQNDQGDSSYQLHGLMVERQIVDAPFDVDTEDCKRDDLLEEKHKLLADLNVLVAKMESLMAGFKTYDAIAHTLSDVSRCNSNDNLTDKSNHLTQESDIQFEIKDLHEKINCIEQERGNFGEEIERLSMKLIEMAQIKTTQISQIDAMEEHMHQCDF